MVDKSQRISRSFSTIGPFAGGLAYKDELKYALERLEKTDEQALGIGRVCVAWSALEMDAALLINGLIDFPDAVSQNTVLGELDFRSRLSLLKISGLPDSQTNLGSKHLLN